MEISWGDIKQASEVLANFTTLVLMPLLCVWGVFIYRQHIAANEARIKTIEEKGALLRESNEYLAQQLTQQEALTYKNALEIIEAQEKLFKREKIRLNEQIEALSSALKKKEKEREELILEQIETLRRSLDEIGMTQEQFAVKQQSYIYALAKGLKGISDINKSGLDAKPSSGDS